MKTENTRKTLLSNWFRNCVGDKMAENFASGKAERVLWRVGLVLASVAVLMHACSSSEHWKEEVQLSDGRIIVVERETIRESGGDEWAFNSSGSKNR